MTLIEFLPARQITRFFSFFATCFIQFYTLLREVHNFGDALCILIPEKQMPFLKRSNCSHHSEDLSPEQRAPDQIGELETHAEIQYAAVQQRSQGR
jgi:hypothetical protein